jgi:hypothetical protein
MKARFRENLTKFCIWNTNLIEWKKKKNKCQSVTDVEYDEIEEPNKVDPSDSKAILV